MSIGDLGSRASAARGEKGAGNVGRGLPRQWSEWTPLKKLAWLESDACRERVQAGTLQASGVRAETRRLKKAAARVALAAPSPCAAEEYWRGYPFPPPAENTPMRRADRVLDESERPVLWPAHYLVDGATYDVIDFETEQRRLAMDLKPQRGEGSAEALRAAGAAGAVIDTGMTLLTEDEAVLKRQIERYRAGKTTSLLPPDFAGVCTPPAPISTEGSDDARRDNRR